jgi:hypothetical protein
VPPWAKLDWLIVTDPPEVLMVALCDAPSEPELTAVVPLVSSSS